MLMVLVVVMLLETHLISIGGGVLKVRQRRMDLCRFEVECKEDKLEKVDSCLLQFEIDERYFPERNDFGAGFQEKECMY